MAKEKRIFNNEEKFKQLENDLDDDQAYELITEIFNNNLGLAFIVMQKKFHVEQFCLKHKVTYEDLESVANHGLWKAVLTFDVNKGFKFATYAAMCINNELGMLYRTLKKSQNQVSMDTLLHMDQDGNILTFKDVIKDETSEKEINNFIESEHNRIFLEKLFDKLNKREKEVIHMYFYEEMNQKEIAEKMNISQSYISRIVKKVVEKGKKIKV